MRSEVKALLEGTTLEAPARAIWHLLRSPKDALYDIQTKAVMKRVITPSSVCVDVGAHRGDLLMGMVALAPKVCHHAFEPLPEMCEELRRRFPTVTIHQLALSDGTGSATFYRNAKQPGLSSLRPEMGVPFAELDIRTARLDDVLETANFIKVDVEGAELQVFKGAVRILSQRPFVVFEHGLGGADRFGTIPGDVYDFLHDLGLRVSLMGHWLLYLRSLSRPEFERFFYHRKAYYFLAHP